MRVADFTKGQKVWAPTEDEGGQVRATFVGVADPNEAVTVNGHRRDAARIIYNEGEDEGLMGLVPYFKLRPRDE
jgi:hypothetical protein